MRKEITSAANFLSNLLRLGNGVEDVTLNEFRVKLEDLLDRHYQEHWFPEKPNKGSGYRCIRINHKMDPIIAKAGFACGVDEPALRRLFPNELTLWVDPKEVSYRIGENGSICVLFDGNKSADKSSTECETRQRATDKSRKNPPKNSAKYSNYYQAHQQQQQQRNNNSYEHSSSKKSATTCKESVRNSWDCFIMDPRNVHFEQLAAYVSSS